MRLTTILLACLISQVISTDWSTDHRYCTTQLCGSSNLACGNYGTLTLCTLKEPRVLNMAKYIEPLTDLFNKLRNDVAAGVYRNLPQAARMAKMSWSQELAWFARLNVLLCAKNSQQCLSSPYYYYIGQLTEEVFTDFGGNTSQNFLKMRGVIEYWSHHVTSLSRRTVLHMPPKFERSTTFKAALLINERNSGFGCALIYFKNNSHFIFSCAFATANIVGRPIYKWGLSPGVRCRALDGKFTKLCAEGENYNNQKGNSALTLIDEE